MKILVKLNGFMQLGMVLVIRLHKEIFYLEDYSGKKS